MSDIENQTRPETSRTGPDWMLARAASSASVLLYPDARAGLPHPVHLFQEALEPNWKSKPFRTEPAEPSIKSELDEPEPIFGFM